MMTESTPATERATATPVSAEETANTTLPGGEDPTPAIDAPETQLRITAVISLLIALFGAGLFAVRAVEQTREAGTAAIERSTQLAAERRAVLEAENTRLETQLVDATARVAELQQAQAAAEARAAELEHAKASAEARAARLEQAQTVAQDGREDQDLEAQQKALETENAQLEAQLARAKISLAELEQAREAAELRADALRRELNQALTAAGATAKPEEPAADLADDWPGAEVGMPGQQATVDAATDAEASAGAGADETKIGAGISAGFATTTATVAGRIGSQTEQGAAQAHRATQETALSERWPAYAELGARFTDDGMLVTLGEQELRFEPGLATLASREPSALRRVNRFLANHPGVRVELRGHTDSTGPAESNRALSKQRAEAVREALISLGTSAKRIRIDGRGEQEPIADNRTAAGRRENRRVEVLLIAERLDLDR